MREYHELRAVVDGDAEAAVALLGVARTQLGVLKNALALGGLPSGKRTVQLPDGTVIQVASVQGQDSVRISVPPRPGQPVPLPEVVALPEHVLGAPPNVYLGALCDAGPLTFFVDNVANHIEAKGVGAGGDPGRIMQLVPCTGGLDYRASFDPSQVLVGRGDAQPVLSVQLFDLTLTRTQPHLSIAGMLGGASYVTFDGRQYISGYNNTTTPRTPFHDTTANLPTLYDAAGNVVPGMRIVKWTQHSGNLPLLPFTLIGGKHPTVLRSAIPLAETLTGPFVAMLPGVVSYASDSDSSTPYGYSWYGYLWHVFYSVFQQDTYTATGTLAVMDLAGVVTTLRVTLTGQYARTGDLPFVEAIGQSNTRSGDVIPSTLPLEDVLAPPGYGAYLPFTLPGGTTTYSVHALTGDTTT